MPEPEVEIKTLKDYTRARQQVIDTLEAIAEEADAMAVNGSGRVREAAHRLEQGLFTILVLGDFKTGKSTFLNALIEQDLLPTAVTPCTAVLAVIEYAEASYVRVRRFQGEGETISLEQFRTDYVLCTAEAENERFRDIEQIEIGIPAALCRDGVRIVDSPGLDESPQRTAITSSHIPRSDAAVFMLGADRLGREHEIEYLRTHILGQGLDNVFFVVNRCDLIDEALDPDRERQALQTRAWQLLAEPGGEPVTDHDMEDRKIFFLSARWAREAQANDDPELLDRSGLPALRTRLEQFLAHDRGRVALQRPAGLGRETAEAVRRAADYRTHLLDVSLAELEQRIAATQPDFERISRAREQAEGIIHTHRERCRTDLAVRLRQKIADLQDGMRRTVRKFDFPGSESFAGRLTASIKIEPVQKAVADQLDRYLSEELGGWIREAEGVVQGYLETMTEQLGDNARQVHRSLESIQLKIIGPRVKERAAEQIRDPVERLMAIQEGLRQGDFSTVFRETQDIWKSTARTLAAEFAGLMLLGMLGLAANPIAFVATMTSVSIGMAFYNTNLAIEQLRNAVADIAREQLKLVPERALPELNRQLDSVFDSFTSAYLRAIDTLVGQEWETLKAIREEKERKSVEAVPERERLDLVLKKVDEYQARLSALLAQFSQ